MRKTQRCMLALLAAAAGVAQAGPGVWTTTGPEGGATMQIVVDPTAPGTLTLAARGGLYRSTDGGDSWSRFEDGLLYQYPYGLVASDTGDAMFVAPDAGTLFRSSGGAGWSPTGLSLPPGAYLLDLSLRAGGDQHLALATSVGVLTSGDGGASFAPAAGTGLPAGVDMARIEHAAGSRLYAAYGQAVPPFTAQVFRSDDNGGTWTPTADLPGFAGFVSYGDGDLEAAPADADRIYFASNGAVYRSNDAGGSWIECATTPGNHRQLAVDAGDPDRLWLATGEALASSTDGCATWTLHGSGLSADGTRPDALVTVVPASGFPVDDRVWVGTEHGGVYRSDDAAATFSAINTGMISSNVRAIAVHPLAASRILVGYGDATSPSATLWRSDDGGGSWTRSNGGLDAVQLRGLAIDPTTAATTATTHVYAVGSSRRLGVAPDPSNTDGGIYKSTDGGVTWSTIDAGLPATYFGTRYIGTVRNIVLDPRSCASPPASGPCTAGPLQTAYVTASGRANHTSGVYEAARVYKSTNAGLTWAASDIGLPLPSLAGPCPTSQIAVPLVIDPRSPDTLYLGLTLNQTDPACPEPTVANGIFKSTDGGATWVHASGGLARVGGPGSSHYNVLALAMDPNDSDVLYAGGYRDSYDFSGGRVFKSIDAGASWSEVSVGVAGADVRALVVDPSDSDTVYAGVGGGSPADPSGVYRSTDGGLTWNSFSIGLPVDAATALTVDPHDATRLLAGTPGGLWEFTQVADEDSDGAVTSVEDAAPNGGDANGNGVQDAGESDVASFFGIADAAPGRGAAPPPAITLDVLPLAGTCARINNAHAIAGGRLPHDVARGVAATLFDRGVLRFELPDCERARVTVTFHGADDSDPDWVWRNYGPLQPGVAGSFGWYTFAGARKIAADTWELTIDAGERGNYRDDAASILFVGAPGFVDIHLFGDGLE
ncbi:WD40/YVTN/BNR-like repeat-containing protein [Chiayiivirga flava]|uniref:Photosystem II stability/assembly factor-like uncharacterized protein n=1 Tax=Chiayiivirga flava TaxID=659595 RepID=A0A7W8FZF4_9GAMM|nr:sialidase family protein [Chiayiivirga flava]MBB5206588.1 photosystem II stability/assembly factor-like uncharacterized protein [Chiayiivirga flava]